MIDYVEGPHSIAMAVVLVTASVVIGCLLGWLKSRKGSSSL